MVAIYLIGEPLRLLNVAGFHPCYQNGWARVRAVITILLAILIFLELFVQAIVQWNGLGSLQAIGMSMETLPILQRAVTMFTHRTTFIKLLDSMEKMGYPNELKELERLRIEMLSKYRNIHGKLMNFSLWSLITLVVMTLLTVPIILREEVTYLPLYHYVNEDTPYREFFCAILCLGGFILGTFFVVSFEFLFVAFVIHLLCGMKVLKNGLVSLGSDNTSHNEMIGLLVSRHCLILSCIENINNICSGIFLNQFLSTTVCLCGCLLGVVVEDSSDWSHNSLAFSALTVSLAQLFGLCMAGTLLMEECESIATAAYGCEWWTKTQPTLRRSLVLTIQRSHRSNMLVAGGMVPMNLASFTRVLNGAFSYYSLLRSVYKH